MSVYILLGGLFTGGVLALSAARLEDRKARDFALWAGGLFLAALVMRLLMGYYSEGFSVDIGTFKSWAYTTNQVGFGEIYQQDIFLDYPPGYLYVLVLLEKLRGVWGLTIEGQAYTLVMKLPSIAADLLCAGVLLWLGKKKLGELSALLAAAAYLFCPAVFVNSAQWGQADSFCTMILLASVLLLYGEKYIPSGLLYGLSIICKPQMLVFAPLYICFTIKKRKFLQLGIGMACALGAILLVAAPFTKNFNYWWLVTKYQSTMNYYDYYTVNACNIWALMGWNWRGMPQGAAGPALTVLAPILATAACGALMLLSRREDTVFVAPAVLMGVVYIFAVKMHERYLFPAFLFLLLAYVFTKSRRMLRAFGFMAGANYLNVSYVLWLFRETGGSYDPNSFAFRAISALQAAALGYLLYACWRVYLAGEKEEPVKTKKARNGSQRKERVIPLPLTKEDRQMGRTDWIVMAAVTLVYGAVAFWNLGGTKMPLTTWTPQEGEQAVLRCETQCNTLWLLPGLAPDENHYAARVGSSLLVETSNDGENWVECGSINDGFVFAWKNFWLETPGKYVRLTALNGNVTLAEAGMTPAGAEAAPAITAAGPGTEALTDEQDTVPLYKTYENSSYFDEIYHARTAYEHILGLEPYENTHPPLGKYIIALGIQIFGMNPFGWRFMGALFGVLMLPILYHLCKRLFGKTWLCGLATLLFAFDFMHFTQTRIATIDTYSVFFLLLMYDAMVVFLQKDLVKDSLKELLLPLGLSGIFMGLGVAAKWTAAYGAVGLAVLYFGKLIAAYLHEAKGRRPLTRVRKRCGVLCAWCCLLFVAIPFAIYFCAFLPITTLPHNAGDPWWSFANYQTNMFNYHSQLVAEHDFASPWYEWPLDLRPIWFFSGDPVNTQGQYSTISSMGNPLLWWVCIPGLGLAVYLWFKERRLACGVALTGFLSVYLPWVLVPRLTFIYHYFTAVPFLVIGLAAGFQWLSEREPLAGTVALTLKGGKTRKLEKAPLCMAGLAAACILLFVIYFPVISGKPTSHEYANGLEMFKTWFFSA